MNRSLAPRIALLLVCVLASHACEPSEIHWDEEQGLQTSATAAASAPDILLVLVDALRPDHLGCYGYDRPTSPFLDRWSQGAARFEAAYTQGTHTRISIASLFTGVRPTVHRIRNVDLESDVEGPGRRMTDALSDRLTTLAESLQPAGYETWGLSSNPHVSSELGFTQGFARWWHTRSRDGARLVEKFLDEWARRRAAPVQRPLFVYLHLMSVHNPYQPPPPYDRAFSVPGGRVVYTNGPAQVSSADLAATVAQYDGGVRFTDSLLETLVTAWENGEEGTGRPRATVILADHGEEFGEHGGLGHGMTVFGELARIPLLIKAPGVPAGAFPEPVTTVDLHRLMIELSGAHAPPEAQGRSFGEWSRPDEADPVVYTESRTGWASYRWKEQTLIFPLSNPARATWFDRRSDPGETVPRTDPAVLSSLRARLDRRLAGDSALARELGAPARKHLGDETEAALKGLGYLAGP